jgi:cytochrome c-type protein NapC
MAGLIKRTWSRLRTPSSNWALGSLLGGGFIAGIVFLIAFTSAVEMSGSDEFCGNACHSLAQTVTVEWKESIHYSNSKGIRAGCADCHLAKEFGPKIWRKTQALWIDVPGEVFGTIDTIEKFEAKRLELAQDVWAEMKANNSRECRSCHSHEAMKLEDQESLARKDHEDALKSGETCIDCHKGVAHHEPVDPSTKEGESDDFSL